MHWHGHDWKMRERWELLFDSLFLTLKNRNGTNKLKYFKFWRDHFCGHHVFNTLQNDLHFYIWLFATGSVMFPLVYIGSVNVVGHAVLGWWCQWDRRNGSRRRSQSTRVKPSKHCIVKLWDHCHFPWTSLLRAEKYCSSSQKRKVRIHE